MVIAAYRIPIYISEHLSVIVKPDNDLPESFFNNLHLPSEIYQNGIFLLLHFVIIMSREEERKFLGYSNSEKKRE